MNNHNIHTLRVFFILYITGASIVEDMKKCGGLEVQESMCVGQKQRGKKEGEDRGEEGGKEGGKEGGEEQNT